MSRFSRLLAAVFGFCGLFLHLGGSDALGATRAVFHLTERMAVITIQDSAQGSPDRDAEVLFDSIREKRFATTDGVLTLSCGDTRTNRSCELVIKDSDRSEVLPAIRKARFQVRGPEAAELSRFFYLPEPDRSFIYTSSDMALEIRSSESEFLAVYHR